jgi:hypothetical protein
MTRRFTFVLLLLAGVSLASAVAAAPKVVIISLDGATPRFVDQYLASGALDPNTGLGLLREKGITAPARW